MLFLFALCLLVYLGNLRTVPLARGGDTIPNRLIPFAILAHGTPTLDPFRSDFRNAGVRTWYLNERRGALVSFYPIGTALAALPVYVPVYAFLALSGHSSPGIMFALSEQTEKLAAASLTGLAVVLFYATIRRSSSSRVALGASLVFAFASSMWATASQMLWQQTAVAFALALGLWLLTSPRLPRWACAAAGLALSLAVTARPTAALLFAAGLFAALLTAGDARLRVQRALAFLLGGVPLIALNLAINMYYFGNLAGGYGLIAGMHSSGLFARDRLLGIAGLLISPNRGLLVFTPIALLGIIGLAQQVGTGKPRDPVLASFGLASFVHLLVVGTYPVWWGGWSFGPRYLVDIIPVLALAGVGTWNRLGAPARRLAMIAILWSALVQVNGVLCYPASQWDGRMSEDPASAAWSLKHPQLLEDFMSWAVRDRWSTPF